MIGGCMKLPNGLYINTWRAPRNSVIFYEIGFYYKIRFSAYGFYIGGIFNYTWKYVFSTEYQGDI